MALRRNLILALAIIAAIVDSKSVPNPIVSTSTGSVEGITSQTVGSGVSYDAFRAIPYAEPPIDQLRFEPPVPKSPWVGTLDGTEDGSPCVQGGDPFVGSEDCLFLNVYTPSSRSRLLPVFVMIPGGGFIGGSAAYDQLGPDYLLEKNLIVVTLNYRLGIFGFGSTGDAEFPGNNGLKDQTVALEWVKANIANFGGDPNQITLGGQSAGAASVGYHLVSPISAGLFQRAILQSGTLINPWALSRNVPSVVRQTALRVGVDITSSTSLKNDLKTIDVGSLQKASNNVANEYLVTQNVKDGLAYGPVQEVPHSGAFFSAKGYELLRQGKFVKVPTLLGYNSLEGYVDLSTPLGIYFRQYDLMPSKLVPINMNVDPFTKQLLGYGIKIYYFQGESVVTSQLRLSQFLGDDQFVRGIVETAGLLSVSTPTYLYRFSYEGGLWGLANRTTPGVTHSEEIGYLWRSRFDPVTPQDDIVRERMVTLWSNFITTGNPTPTPQAITQNVIWPQTNVHWRTYVDIGTNMVVKIKPGGADLAFWDYLYGLFARPPHDTY